MAAFFSSFGSCNIIGTVAFCLDVIVGYNRLLIDLTLKLNQKKANDLFTGTKCETGLIDN
jgi:hypothetical protein